MKWQAPPGKFIVVAWFPDGETHQLPQVFDDRARADDHAQRVADKCNGTAWTYDDKGEW